MSQPNTTLQNPKPLSSADRNLSLWIYFPRNTPSMSVTATLTRAAGDPFTDSMIFWSADLLFFMFEAPPRRREKIMPDYPASVRCLLRGLGEQPVAKRRD